jgi:charged multivesicular body protein 1
MTKIMDEFEKQFEDLDVQSEYVENTINQTTALSTPQDQVDELIAQVNILFPNETYTKHMKTH